MKRQALLILLMVFVSIDSSAQTGPGGVGNSTTNEIWLRADSGVYNNGGTNLASNNDNVQEWHDVSGNSNDAIQNTAGFRPQYQTNQANGFPALDFDGNDDRILSSGVSTSNQATIFTVVRADAVTNNNDGIIHAAPAGQEFTTNTNEKTIGMWIERTTLEPWGRGIQSNNTIRSLPTVNSISTGTFYVITNHYNGSDITQYINGAVSGSISYDGTLKSWTEFGIGRQGNESFTGDIAEVIAYTVSLNDAQMIIVHNYLKAKYGITLTSNNIYTMDTPGNGNYDYEVAGIGRASNSSITHTDSRGTSIVRISKSGAGLGDNEYMLWGHENGDLNSFGHYDVPSGLDARLGRMWKISEQGEVGDVNVDFDLTGLGPVTVTDLRLLVDTDGDGDFSDATSYSGASAQGGNIYRFTTSGNNEFENGYVFTIGTINVGQTPLPITLLEFNCITKGDVVQINWITATEINNEKFEIERSSDLKNWEAIHTTPGAGNSQMELEYEYTDLSPLTGTTYYRLKQTDFEGSYTYSAIEVVSWNKNIEKFRVFPNPVSGNSIFLESPEPISGDIFYQVFSMDGKLQYANSIQNVGGDKSSFQLKLPSLSGSFILRMNVGSETWVEKIEISK